MTQKYFIRGFAIGAALAAGVLFGVVGAARRFVRVTDQSDGIFSGRLQRGN